MNLTAMFWYWCGESGEIESMRSEESICSCSSVIFNFEPTMMIWVEMMRFLM